MVGYFAFLNDRVGKMKKCSCVCENIKGNFPNFYTPKGLAQSQVDMVTPAQMRNVSE